MKAQAHIKQWLRAEGRTKSWLASQVAVKPTTLSRWLSGKAIPTPQARILLSQVAGMDVTNNSAWREE